MPTASRRGRKRSSSCWCRLTQRAAGTPAPTCGAPAARTAPRASTHSRKSSCSCRSSSRRRLRPSTRASATTITTTKGHTPTGRARDPLTRTSPWLSSLPKAKMARKERRQAPPFPPYLQPTGHLQLSVLQPRSSPPSTSQQPLPRPTGMRLHTSHTTRISPGRHSSSSSSNTTSSMSSTMAKRISCPRSPPRCPLHRARTRSSCRLSYGCWSCACMSCAAAWPQPARSWRPWPCRWWTSC
mmetsp:Transcript_16364/g.44819  ORF Transcript_16364/g.44819 Transcript_16364/m.44819 type:complete len:241 (+) Transcript_16364:766-1488(+)